MVQAFEVDQVMVEGPSLPISNFGLVSKSIWRGGVPSNHALKQLAEHGVKTVIDLRYDGSGCKQEENFASMLGMNYIHIPIGFHRADSSYIVQFLKIVSNPVNLPVYIHCHQGADRTGTLIGIYRVFVQHWSFDKTYNEMRTYHFKPWLFGMKKSVSSVADNQITRHAIELALSSNAENKAGIPTE